MELERAYNNLYNLLAIEQEYWRVRSKSHGLKYSDRNTFYFHHHSSHRRQQNTTSSLKLENGELVTEQKEITKEVVSYYSNFFSLVQHGIDFEEYFCRASFAPFQLSRKSTCYALSPKRSLRWHYCLCTYLNL